MTEKLRAIASFIISLSLAAYIIADGEPNRVQHLVAIIGASAATVWLGVTAFRYALLRSFSEAVLPDRR